MFYAIAFLILLVIFSLAIATLVIFVKLRSGDVAVLRKLPGYKPHLLYGNTLKIAREPDELVEQMLEWVTEHAADGVSCIWLGPLQPFVLLYKPVH